MKVIKIKIKNEERMFITDQHDITEEEIKNIYDYNFNFEDFLNNIKEYGIYLTEIDESNIKEIVLG